MYKGNTKLKKEKKGKSYKKLFAVISVIILLTITLITLYTINGITEKEIYYKNIEIKNGQTLWKIVENEFGNDSDIRKYVYQIKKINNLENSNISPGQVLKIPVEKEV
ncbi:MAG: LysM peptidoglycan-binding domain-containing protein [Halanaerobiales bacterium]|nr:LysM peptidoglycan-binding domain-containing protein [Halanaerobiales bacterium]